MISNYKKVDAKHNLSLREPSIDVLNIRGVHAAVVVLILAKKSDHPSFQRIPASCGCPAVGALP